jgi:hypothetical protein
LNEIEQKLANGSLAMPVVFIVGKYAFPINQETLSMVAENEQ